MSDNKNQMYRSLMYASSLGIAMVAAILIGLYVGYQLDKWLDTSPWFTLVFLFLGIISGFRNIFILSKRAMKDDSDQQDTDDQH
ncbi:MAG: magnesium transporter [Desulfuromonas sp.]|nr:MAG: magnesium transporter [Desulfuromonas sp.]